jgi:kanamycin kinase
VVAEVPRGEVAVPPAVRRLAAGLVVRAVWVNATGGTTFQIGEGPGRRFVKWAPAGSGIDLAREAARLAWAGRFHPVPRVLDQGEDADGSWLVTAGLPGENAVAARWRADPARAVTAVGRGLRALHDVLPVPACPFSWAAEERVADVRRRAAAGRLDPSGWDPGHRPLGVAGALRVLAAAPPVDRLVVSHGDACAPNTVVDEAGRWSGHVDLGALGVADRWADLAVATWSARWNYGPGWEATMLEAYGVDPDPVRTRYHRLLWDLGP